MIERSHLEIVSAVKKYGTLTEAANQLCLTQSALSHAVKKLEISIGTAIWSREGRNLQLTHAGDELLKLAKRVLPQFEHLETKIKQIAAGERGTLRFGMECHPCYQWLLKAVNPFLKRWPDVDVDVKQKFQFGGIQALFSRDIDLLVTPDPITKKGLIFKDVFTYEQVLVVPSNHPLAKQKQVLPNDLKSETLLTYPVAVERLDIFRDFLLPARCSPKQHKAIETTDILFALVAAGRGLTALPNWLVQEYSKTHNVHAVQLGESAMTKKLYLGYREEDGQINYLSDFVKQARKI